MNASQPHQAPARQAPEKECTVHAYSSGEKLADLASHGLGIAASIAGLVMLVIVGSRFESALPVTSYTIYGGALLLGFIASTLYHVLHRSRIAPALRIADHSSIYVLIAGTYTPVTLIGLQGAWGWSLFGVVWGIALLGVMLKVVFPGRLERLSIGLYVALGWVGLVGIEPVVDRLSWPALALLGCGGVLFSLGVIFLLWRRLPYHNLIWHLFVIAGATAHYFSIIYFVRPLA